MRRAPPPAVIRERWVFLFLALACVGVAIMLSETGSVSAGGQLWPMLLSAFVWLTGIYFLMEVGYPHIRVTDELFVSRIEQASDVVRWGATMFAAIYLLGCLVFTVVAFRGVTDG